MTIPIARQPVVEADTVADTVAGTVADRAVAAGMVGAAGMAAVDRAAPEAAVDRVVADMALEDSRLSSFLLSHETLFARVRPSHRALSLTNAV